MKIENGKLIYEVVTCWNCNGLKQAKNYTLCPLNNGPVKKLSGSKCPHCGAKNRYSHQVVGEYMIPCPRCSATGTIQEDEMTMMSQNDWNEMVKHFKFTVSRVKRYGTFVEQYIGGGESIYGVTDYGAARLLSDEEILKKVPTDSHPSYPNQIVKNGVLATEYCIEIRTDGYSVYPIFPKA